jgi:hypothetical protein
VGVAYTSEPTRSENRRNPLGVLNPRGREEGARRKKKKRR